MSEHSIDQEPDDAEESKAAQHNAGAPIAPAPAFATKEPRVGDLSQEIVRTLPRVSGERVTCRWISGNNYRCNWWTAQSPADYDNPGMQGLMVTTHRVSRSEMLHVTRNANGLTIQN